MKARKSDLRDWPTCVEPVYASKAAYQEILADHVPRLSDQQQMLSAANTHAVLLIFQAMDAADKDGVIRHVMSGVNPGVPSIQRRELHALRERLTA